MNARENRVTFLLDVTTIHASQLVKNQLQVALTKIFSVIVSRSDWSLRICDSRLPRLPLETALRKLGPSYIHIGPGGEPDFTEVLGSHGFERTWDLLHDTRLATACDDAAKALDAPSTNPPVKNLVAHLVRMADSKLFSPFRHETGDSDDVRVSSRAAADPARSPSAWHVLVVCTPLPATAPQLDTFLTGSPAPSSSPHATALSGNQREALGVRLKDIGARLAQEGVRLMVIDTGEPGPLSTAVGEAVATSLEAAPPSRKKHAGHGRPPPPPPRPWVLPLAHAITLDSLVPMHDVFRAFLEGAQFPLHTAQGRAGSGAGAGPSHRPSSSRPTPTDHTVLVLREGAEGGSAASHIEVQMVHVGDTSVGALPTGPLRVVGRTRTAVEWKLHCGMLALRTTVLTPRPSSQPARSLTSSLALQLAMTWLATQGCGLLVQDVGTGAWGVLEPADCMGRKGMLRWYAHVPHVEPQGGGPAPTPIPVEEFIDHLRAIEADVDPSIQALMHTAHLSDVAAGPLDLGPLRKALEQEGETTALAMLNACVLPFNPVHRALASSSHPPPREVLITEKDLYTRKPFPGLLDVLPPSNLTKAPAAAPASPPPAPAPTVGWVDGEGQRWASEAYAKRYAARRALWSGEGAAAATTAVKRDHTQAKQAKSLADEVAVSSAAGCDTSALLEGAKATLGRLVDLDASCVAQWAPYVEGEGATGVTGASLSTWQGVFDALCGAQLHAYVDSLMGALRACAEGSNDGGAGDANPPTQPDETRPDPAPATQQGETTCAEPAPAAPPSAQLALKALRQLAISSLAPDSRTMNALYGRGQILREEAGKLDRKTRALTLSIAVTLYVYAWSPEDGTGGPQDPLGKADLKRLQSLVEDANALRHDFSACFQRVLKPRVQRRTPKTVAKLEKNMGLLSPAKPLLIPAANPAPPAPAAVGGSQPDDLPATQQAAADTARMPPPSAAPTSRRPPMLRVPSQPGVFSAPSTTRSMQAAESGGKMSVGGAGAGAMRGFRNIRQGLKDLVPNARAAPLPAPLPMTMVGAGNNKRMDRHAKELAAAMHQEHMQGQAAAQKPYRPGIDVNKLFRELQPVQPQVKKPTRGGVVRRLELPDLTPEVTSRPQADTQTQAQGPEPAPRPLNLHQGLFARMVPAAPVHEPEPLPLPKPVPRRGLGDAETPVKRVSATPAVKRRRPHDVDDGEGVAMTTARKKKPRLKKKEGAAPIRQPAFDAGRVDEEHDDVADNAVTRDLMALAALQSPARGPAVPPPARDDTPPLQVYGGEAHGEEVGPTPADALKGGKRKAGVAGKKKSAKKILAEEVEPIHMHMQAPEVDQAPAPEAVPEPPQPEPEPAPAPEPEPELAPPPPRPSTHRKKQGGRGSKGKKGAPEDDAPIPAPPVASPARAPVTDSEPVRGEGAPSPTSVQAPASHRQTRASAGAQLGVAATMLKRKAPARRKELISLSTTPLAEQGQTRSGRTFNPSPSVGPSAQKRVRSQSNLHRTRSDPQEEEEDGPSQSLPSKSTAPRVTRGAVAAGTVASTPLPAKPKPRTGRKAAEAPPQEEEEAPPQPTYKSPAPRITRRAVAAGAVAQDTDTPQPAKPKPRSSKKTVAAEPPAPEEDEDEEVVTARRSSRKGGAGATPVPGPAPVVVKSKKSKRSREAHDDDDGDVENRAPADNDELLTSPPPTKKQKKKGSKKTASEAVAGTPVMAKGEGGADTAADHRPEPTPSRSPFVAAAALLVGTVGKMISHRLPRGGKNN